MPWARPGARHTWAFEDTCAWLSAHAAISVVAVFLRVAWRAIAAIVAQVLADGRDTSDLLAGLTRIGVDEIAYRKGHRYVTCVLEHTTGRLVWAGEGRNQDTLGKFFDQLGAQRCAALTRVSCDGAEWIHTVLRARGAAGGGLPASVSCRGLGAQGPRPGAGAHHGPRRRPRPSRDAGDPQEPGRPDR
ncbi:transposase [Candidatus Mycobacterium methanotrophicum]|uniref:Transposase n=1 Tax=Candidatus Mycobacterium methanotrophicum TaxID=2943498 RepID=A0ABY4QM32_9MYCO|nr:transposase [Candidatus Mycobacterium methanotrophicum]UQX12043.1 transposase [Candidatus Mycobacterium methanotrophicum]